jgi:UDP-N-acetylglucosamine acyltransferase
MISGNVAVHQFVRIGRLAMISGLAKIVQDIPPYMMTNREGEVVGENRVGLIRAKCLAAERKDIKAAFRIIYRSGLSRAAAIECLAQTVTSDAGRLLLDFLSADSKRGMSRDSIRIRRAA